MECEGKIQYTTYKEAQTAINYAKKASWRKRCKKIPKRAYECPICGYYHLTSNTKEYYK